MPLDTARGKVTGADVHDVEVDVVAHIALPGKYEGAAIEAAASRAELAADLRVGCCPSLLT